MKNNSYYPVRVIDVIYNDKHPLFEQLGGWDSIGTVFYTPIDNPYHITRDLETLPYAYPNDPNITTYPIKNELVYIIDGPSPTLVGTGIKSGKKYWTSTAGVWGSIHHNAYPADGDRVQVGTTFNEQPIVDRLIPEEGDTILQSRYGSTIRLGSTNSEGESPWSVSGETGDPIVIINSTHPTFNENTKPGVNGKYEGPHDNGSGIFLTTTQKLPIEYEPEFTKLTSTTQLGEYSNAQAYIHSDRIVNSAIEDVITIGRKSVYTETDKYSLVSRHTYINSNKIYLGEDAAEKGVLGNTLLDILKELIEALIEANTTLSTTVTPPPGTPLLQVNQAAITFNARMAAITPYLSTILAEKTFIE